MKSKTRRRPVQLVKYPDEAAKLRRLAEPLYGRGYRSRVLEEAGVTYRTAMRWAKGETRPPGAVLAQLRAKTATRDDDLEAIKALVIAILQTFPKSVIAEIFEVAAKDATDRVVVALDKFCRQALAGNKGDDKARKQENGCIGLCWCRRLGHRRIGLCLSRAG